MSDTLENVYQLIKSVLLNYLSCFFPPHNLPACLGVEGSESDHHLWLLLVLQVIGGLLLDPAGLDHSLTLDPRVEGVDPTQERFFSLWVSLKS